MASFLAMYVHTCESVQLAEGGILADKSNGFSLICPCLALTDLSLVDSLRNRSRLAPFHDAAPPLSCSVPQTHAS